MYVLVAGDIGGLLGLLLGASAVTLFEVLDLILYNTLRKCGKNKEENPVSASDPPDNKECHEESKCEV